MQQAIEGRAALLASFHALVAGSETLLHSLVKPAKVDRGMARSLCLQWDGTFEEPDRSAFFGDRFGPSQDASFGDAFFGQAVDIETIAQHVLVVEGLRAIGCAEEPFRRGNFAIFGGSTRRHAPCARISRPMVRLASFLPCWIPAMNTSRTFFRRLLLCALAAPLLHCSGTVDSDSPFAGSGSAKDPYRIATLEDLRWLSENPDLWSSHFVQVADIDAQATAAWNRNSGFLPVGLIGTRGFRGTYNGKGHVIRGLTIDRPEEPGAGLFAIIAGGVVDSVVLLDASVRGQWSSGVLAGVNQGAVRNCRATGRLVGTNATDIGQIGGLVGDNTAGARIESSEAAVSVLAPEAGRVGGLVGSNSGMVAGSRASGLVNGDESVGGLVGHSWGLVRSCQASGLVAGDRHIGGLIGASHENSTIETSFATGSVEGRSDVGGLAGVCNACSVTSSYATGTVTGKMIPGNPTGPSDASSGKTSGLGGLIGFGAGRGTYVTRSFARGDVSGDSAVGDLVGAGSGGLRQCYASGKVTGTTHAGGLIGIGTGTADSCFWDMQATGRLEASGSGFPLAGSAGLSLAEMRKAASYVGWDFSADWAIDEGAGYPWLRAAGKP